MLLPQLLRQMRRQVGRHLGIGHGPVSLVNNPFPQVLPHSCGSGLAREAIC
jgi:hypothetical protein